VPKYEAMKFRIDQMKEKETRMQKKKEVLDTLEQQV
jgi:hypothetical protein